MFPVKLFTTLFMLLFSVSLALAQADLCDNCYVWEFTTEKGERDQTTRLLSNDIEDILSSYAACKVLQRSKFAKLLEQINNEKAIENLSEVKPELKTQLKAIQAKRVIFGEVNRDFTGNVSLRLSFDNLISTQTRTNTVFLIGDDYYNFEKRKQKLTAFINSFVNPDGKLVTPGVSEGSGVTTKSFKLESTKTPQTWEGTVTQTGWGTYPMILYIEKIENENIDGKINWPSFKNSITDMKGKLVERTSDFIEESKWKLVDKMIKGSKGIWFRFTQTKMLVGNPADLDLTGKFYCHISTDGVMNGVWFRGDSTNPEATFIINLGK